MGNIKINALLLIVMALILISPVSDIFANPKKDLTGFTEEGIASWYGPGFHGRKTANGERFNTNEMTAAHKTLPFNTLVKVVNLENGLETIVRINDRGPFKRGRIIDLSHASKSIIGMDGLAKVRIEVITPEDLEQEEAEEVRELLPINLFEETLPVSSMIFIEYDSEIQENDNSLSDEEFKKIFTQFRRVKIKILTTDSQDASETIYQKVNEDEVANYYDVTDKIRFVRGFTMEVGNFTDKSQAYELIGKLEANDVNMIFVQEKTSTTDKTTNYRIFAGNYKARHEATKDRKRLEMIDLTPKLVRIGS